MYKSNRKFNSLIFQIEIYSLLLTLYLLLFTLYQLPLTINLLPTYPAHKGVQNKGLRGIYLSKIDVKSKLVGSILMLLVVYFNHSLNQPRDRLKISDPADPCSFLGKTVILRNKGFLACGHR